MNDRYLYRAKRTDTGEWVEGYYALIGNKHVIISKESEGYYTEFVEERHGYEIVNVDPLTACQCTGLKDFFEKDIVKRTDIHKVGDPSIGIIEYDVENTAFVIHWIDKEKYSPMYPWKDKIKVIGNIFCDPELLEAGE